MTEMVHSLTVSADHPALPGHFPGQPIVPGVVLLTEVAEAARDLLAFAAGETQWRRVKFLAPVLPDQRVDIHLSGDADGFTFRILSAEEQLIARGQCRHAEVA